MIREQKVVKNEERPAQGLTRSVDKLIRSHGLWVVFPKEAGEVVQAGNQSIHERI